MRINNSRKQLLSYMWLDRLGSRATGFCSHQGRLMAKRLPMLFMLVSFCASAQASIIYTATLTGAAENPATDSQGTGSAIVEYDSLAHTLKVDVSFQNLTGTTTAAHIHCCVSPPGNIGVATTTPTFPGFPLGVTSGTFSNTFDLMLASSFNAAFVTANGGTLAGAEAALANGLANGQAYFNIHTSYRTGGEIRGFLAPVPIPTAMWLFGTGLLGLIGFARRKKN